MTDEERENDRRILRAFVERFVKYVREDRAVTPGVTRLARLANEADRYLLRMRDPDEGRS